jgi:hypothetical protein
MSVHLCVVLDGADDEGEAVGAVPADTVLTAVLAAPDDDVAEDVCVVAALAIAVLPPNPTPSAVAPIAVPVMILPSRVFTMSVSLRSGVGAVNRTPARPVNTLQRHAANRMKTSDYSPRTYVRSRRPERTERRPGGQT